MPFLFPLFDSTLLLTKAAVNAVAFVGASVTGLARRGRR